MTCRNSKSKAERMKYSRGRDSIYWQSSYAGSIATLGWKDLERSKGPSLGRVCLM